jgi:endonuclease G
MKMTGYDPKFLGDNFEIELPVVSAELQNKIAYLTTEPNQFVLDYPNYSVVLNKETRTAFYSAANSDFSPTFKGRGRKFRKDTRVLDDHQVGNEYYRRNDWDRGHLARRAPTAFGTSQRNANKASKDTCYFPNISFQHKNFNQDEWGELELRIEHREDDVNDKFNIVSGPIFSDSDRYHDIGNNNPVRIPAAYFKVITFISKATPKKVITNAFVVYQDELALSRMGQVKGRRGIDVFKRYQTSTTLVEYLTGLEFPEICFETNPLKYFDDDGEPLPFDRIDFNLIE